MSDAFTLFVLDVCHAVGPLVGSLAMMKNQTMISRPTVVMRLTPWFGEANKHFTGETVIT